VSLLPTINRRGANRLVILTKRYAFKFPTCRSWRDFLFGLLNNQTEARVGRSGREGVCPVLFAIPGGFLVVMPRVATLTRGEFVTFDFQAFIERHKLCVEAKPDSFGVHEDKIVAVDYGWDN
jgi:hypothetical protein